MGTFKTILILEHFQIINLRFESHTKATFGTRFVWQTTQKATSVMASFIYWQPCPWNVFMKGFRQVPIHSEYASFNDSITLVEQWIIHVLYPSQCRTISYKCITGSFTSIVWSRTALCSGKFTIRGLIK